MFVVLLLLLSGSGSFVHGNWQEWWTYDGISGPSYWSINPAWTMCNKGRKQSPINIDPRELIHDPKLTRFHVDKHAVEGNLENTGQSLVFKVDNERVSKMPINISGGPLTYRYQFEQMYIHWGNEDGGGSSSSLSSKSTEGGSEHTINGHSFPAEVQLYGFNAHLFNNLSEAVLHPNGVVGVAILVQVADRGTSQGLKPITSKLSEMIYRGKVIPIHNFNLGDLLPSTDHYMTYDGSTTYPGCWETVTWVIMNKPIYISRTELYGLRQLMKGDKKHPKAPLGNNIRSVQQLNRRSIRTNINFDSFYVKKSKNKHQNKHHHRKQSQKSSEETCPDIFNEVEYKASSWLNHENNFRSSP